MYGNVESKFSSHSLGRCVWGQFLSLKIIPRIHPLSSFLIPPWHPRESIESQNVARVFSRYSIFHVCRRSRISFARRSWGTLANFPVQHIASSDIANGLSHLYRARARAHVADDRLHLSGIPGFRFRWLICARIRTFFLELALHVRVGLLFRSPPGRTALVADPGWKSPADSRAVLSRHSFHDANLHRSRV